MRLDGKVAVIHGGGGAIGGAVARAFAREGARVFLAGRSREKLDKVARDIAAAGGAGEAQSVDAFDERAVEAHADDVVAKSGRIDIMMNAIGVPHIQGRLFADLSLQDFTHPITEHARTLFVTSKAAARHMATTKSGVILTLSTPGSWLPGTGYFGYGVACAMKEGFSRLLAAELAPIGVRVNCIRPHAIPEASAAGSYARDVFEPIAAKAGVTVAEMLDGAAQSTLLKRLPTLANVAETAVFLASDAASAMTGAVANLSCGVLVD